MKMKTLEQALMLLNKYVTRVAAKEGFEYLTAWCHDGIPYSSARETEAEGYADRSIVTGHTRAFEALDNYIHQLASRYKQHYVVAVVLPGEDTYSYTREFKNDIGNGVDIVLSRNKLRDGGHA